MHMTPIRAVFVIVITALLPLLSGCSISHALRVEDRSSVDIRTMINEVDAVPVVFVGERHNEGEHHKVQLAVLQGLKAKGKTLAIGMEMFEAASQPALDDWSAGRITTNAFIEVYKKNWRNIAYWLYGDIFDFARDNHIPIIALNAPQFLVRKVSQQGFASLTDTDKRLLPQNAATEISDQYMEFIRLSYGVHGNNGEHFRTICEAQMLRNRVMADRIKEYHRLHADVVIVVFAGGGHVRKQGGIPAELDNLPFKIIIPPIPSLSAQSIRAEDADFLLEEPFSLFDLL